MRRLTGSLLVLLMCACVAPAQTTGKEPMPAAAMPPQDVVSGTARNEFGFWGGGSFSSPTLIGKTEGTRLGIFSLRYARVLAAGRGLAFKYTVDAVPLAVLSFPRFEAVPAGGGFTFREVRRSRYAAGLMPVGFQLNFRRGKRVQPFAATSGGFLYFAEPVPDERGRRFNFTADFGGGVQVARGERGALTFSYKYHHISNAYRGVVNPGFDSNLFYAGFSIFK